MGQCLSQCIYPPSIPSDTELLVSPTTHYSRLRGGKNDQGVLFRITDEEDDLMMHGNSSSDEEEESGFFGSERGSLRPQRRRDHNYTPLRGSENSSAVKTLGYDSEDELYADGEGEDALLQRRSPVSLTESPSRSPWPSSTQQERVRDSLWTTFPAFSAFPGSGRRDDVLMVLEDEDVDDTQKSVKKERDARVLTDEEIKELMSSKHRAMFEADPSSTHVDIFEPSLSDKDENGWGSDAVLDEIDKVLAQPIR